MYLLLVGIFFAGWSQGLVMFSLYLLGILVALITGLLLRKTLFKGESSAFVLEMPSYRIPTIKGVLIHAGERSWEFLRKAGVIIFPAVLLMWLLASLPFGVEYASADSLIGMAGSTIAPIFAPLEFGFAEAAVAILMGLFAKEVVVGAFGTLYGVGEEGLGDVLMNVFTPLSAYFVHGVHSALHALSCGDVHDQAGDSLLENDRACSIWYVCDRLDRFLHRVSGGCSSWFYLKHSGRSSFFLLPEGSFFCSSGQ